MGVCRFEFCLEIALCATVDVLLGIASFCMIGSLLMLVSEMTDDHIVNAYSTL